MNQINQAEYLGGRIREVLLDGRWIANTNFKVQLANCSWQQATRRVAGLNSIAMLVYHVNYYLAGLLRAFETGKLDIRDQFSFDLPVIDSAKAWEDLVDEFLTNADRFASIVAAFTDEKLYSPFIDPAYGTTLRNIEGVIEHCYYHLGQVVLINRLLESGQ